MGSGGAQNSIGVGTRGKAENLPSQIEGQTLSGG